MADKAAAGTTGTAAAGAPEPKTVTLTQAWSHKGKIYGPGTDIEVPGDFPDDIAGEDGRDATTPTLAYNESARPGSSGSGVEQTEDHVTTDGTVSRFNADRDNQPLTRKGQPAGPDTGDAAGDKSSFPTTRDALAKKSKDELQAEADRQGLEVEGSGADGNVLKEDLIDALAED